MARTTNRHSAIQKDGSCSLRSEANQITITHGRHYFVTICVLSVRAAIKTRAIVNDVAESPPCRRRRGGVPVATQMRTPWASTNNCKGPIWWTVVNMKPTVRSTSRVLRFQWQPTLSTLSPSVISIRRANIQFELRKCSSSRSFPPGLKQR
jgi:hypothetical protein